MHIPLIRKPRKRALLAVLAGLLALVFVGHWALHHAIERVLSTALDSQVDVKRLNVQWWPPIVSLREVTVSRGAMARRPAMVLGRVAVSLQVPREFGATWRIPRVDIHDIRLAPASVMHDEALARVNAGVDSFPRADPSGVNLDAVIEEETAALRERLVLFRQRVEPQLDQWEALFAQPAEARAIHQADVHAQWRAIQAFHAALITEPERRVNARMHQWGLDEAAWHSVAAALTEDRLHDWFQAALGLHDLLAFAQQRRATEPMTAPRFIIDRIRLSGVLQQSSRVGQLTGEILNFTDQPAQLQQPVTLSVMAKGEKLGRLRLTGVLDHRASSGARDSVTLSWHDVHLVDVPWVRRPDFRVRLGDARLNMDVSGALLDGREVNVHFRQTWTARQVSVEGGGRHAPLLKALADMLQTTPDVTVSVAMSGDVQSPRVHVSSEVKDMLVSLMQDQLSASATELRERLRARLVPALDAEIDKARPAFARASRLASRWLASSSSE